MTEPTTTPFSNKVSILADLWLNYRNDEEFADFLEYNDLGLPLAYALDNKIVEPTPIAESFIEETFELLLAGLEVTDTGFDNLDEILGTAEEA
jgi:hypothetical protein